MLQFYNSVHESEGGSCDGHALHSESMNMEKRLRRKGKVARFSFNELCGEAVGASDYVHIAKTFDCVFVEGIPKMNLHNRNELRRFITLIDVLYEESSLLVALAAASPLTLLEISELERKESTHDEIFAFDRTASRLMEMQSEAYLREVLGF